MRQWILLMLLVALVGVAGCTVMSQDQKDWVTLKAERSHAYVALMDKGQTLAAEDKAWIKSQDDSWTEWARKVKIGIAAPSWAVKQEPTTAPAGVK
jgi:hypothetical protein